MLAALAAASAALLTAAPAGAATLSVNTPNDTSVSNCTLRDAIASANSNGNVGACTASGAYGADAIQFNLPNPSTITLGSPLPSVNGDLTIAGPGASGLRLSGADTYQVLDVNSGVASVSGLTISHGMCTACQGAGVHIGGGSLTLDSVVVDANTTTASGGTDAFAEGGGIENNGGALRLVGSAVTNNVVTASGASMQNGASGAGIINRGTLSLERSTVSGNQTTATGTGGTSTTNSTGSGVMVNGATTVSQTTVSGNTITASGGSSNSSGGGGIQTFNNPGVVSLSLDRSTISGNSGGTGGLIYQSSGSAMVSASTITGNTGVPANVSGNVTFRDSIVSHPTPGANCGGTFVSQGYNLEDANSCGFNQPSDLPNTVTGLDPLLLDNGGPTKTHRLLPGSVAIDRGNASGATADQRGSPRPFDFDPLANAAGGDASDIGAVELQGTPAPTSMTLVASKKKVRKKKKGKAVTLTVGATPCPGRAGDTVQLLRGSIPVATAMLDSSCAASITVRVKKKSSYTATVPADTEHLLGASASVRVKVSKKKHKRT
jgi:hypothetical protein